MTERDLFIAALEKGGPEERQAYLAEACAGRPVLREQVEALLRLHENAGSLLMEPVSEATGAIGATPGGPTAAAGAEGPGSVFGPYRLLELLGEGGMGTVWLAEQAEPLRRTVAVKVIKAGMDSCQVLARFEQERQALAL